MQTSGLPTRVAVPFADSGTKNTIPVPSQIGITGGAASFTTGFPPLTMTPIGAGGIPPFGADFNGILNAITVALRWNTAGSGYPFDSTFSTTVSGYPKGALLPASDFSGYWLNTSEANTTTPENSTSATTGWVPGVHYGVTALTGLASSSVILTTLQAAKTRITLAGTLTSNINLTFPAWTRSWTVVNNCVGAFSVTCKTPSGTGVVIGSGISALINCDGTNITQDSNQQIPVATATASGNAINLAQLNAVITALALGNASTKTVGTGANQIPDMNSFTFSGTAAGWAMKVPQGIIQGGITGGITTAPYDVGFAFPVAFPNQVLGLWDYNIGAVGGSQKVEWSFNAPSLLGCSVRAIGVIVQGSTSVNTPYAGITCGWVAIGR